jgi:HSP20 family molecular chaperone IbpA
VLALDHRVPGRSVGFGRRTETQEVPNGSTDLILKADLAGVKPDDIEVEGRVLTVSGEHEEKAEEKEERKTVKVKAKSE